jgi:hypothetical protein
MVTGKAIAELVRWGEAAAEGDSATAERHLRQFYHLGASLVASKEFQAAWRSKWNEPLASGRLQDACNLLETIAGVESNQVATWGKSTD